MTDFLLFAKELIKLFFDHIWSVFTGVGSIFDIPSYIAVFEKNNNDGTPFTVGHWFLAIFLVLLMVAAIGAIIYLIIYFIIKRVRLNKTFVSQDELLAEVAALNREVMKAHMERDKILAMKTAQMGPEAIARIQGEGAVGGTTESEGQRSDAVNADESRFMKLTNVDKEMQTYMPPAYNNELSLQEICERFRNFCCSRMGLYYEPKVIRLFLSAFGCTRLIILQGISGTGKTSLPYAFGKFLQNDAEIAAVQPSWRDRTEMFGYFNEFTKRFNETEILKRLYEATYTDDVYVTILDEMNIARVEYYFAEMLSILEMPSRDEWVIDLVPSGWTSDPKHIIDGRFQLPENVWYIGTANNDDSTFSISDKVYDRAIPINIDSKGVPFDAVYTPNISLSFKHLESLFTKAKEEHPVSEVNLEKISALDDYVIEHFRLAFGNRILKQLKEFVPCFIAAGGTEIDGIDYILCNKIFRKFESLNLAFIRDEIDGLIHYLNENFGQNNMKDCKDYLKRLQKLF